MAPANDDYRKRLAARKRLLARAAQKQQREKAFSRGDSRYSSPTRQENPQSAFNVGKDFAKGMATDFALGLTKPVYLLADKTIENDEGILGKEQFLRGQAQLFTGFGSLAPEQEFIDRVKQDTKEYSKKEFANDILSSYANFIGPGLGGLAGKTLRPAVKISNNVLSGAARGMQNIIPMPELAGALVGGGITTRIPKGSASKYAGYNIPYGAAVNVGTNINNRIVFATGESVTNPGGSSIRGTRKDAAVLADRANQGTRRRVGDKNFTPEMKLSDEEWAKMATGRGGAREQLPNGTRINQAYVDRWIASGRNPNRMWETGHAHGSGHKGKPTQIESFDLNQLENQARRSGAEISSPEDTIRWALKAADTPNPKGRTRRIFKEIRGMSFDEAVSWLGAEHLV